MSVADRNKKDTELMYSLLNEGKLDLMYLPSGVIAWLWDRPETQVHAARDLAVAAKDTCPVTDGALLRSDQNVLVLKCEDGHKFNVYPDGGYGCDGEPLDIHGCMKLLDNGMEPVEPEECPMEGGVAPQPELEYMPPNPPNMPAEMAYMEEGEDNRRGFDFNAINEGKELYLDNPNFIANAVKYMRRNPGYFLDEFKKLIRLENAPIISFQDFKPENVEKRERIWRQFGKAMYDEDFEQAARIWQDYGMSIGAGEEGVLMAGQMAEAKEDYWGPTEWRRHYNMRRDEGASEEELEDIKAKMRGDREAGLGPVATSDTRKERQWQTKEEEGESIIDKDRQDRMVDTICKTRAVGSEFMKNLGIGEDEGGTGWAGPMGDALSHEYSFQDELEQIGAFVEEELKKYQDE